MRRGWPLLCLLILSACTESTSVTLAEIDGSGVSAVADLHEAITKSFEYRVDAFVSVDEPSPDMRAAVFKGSCAAPGELHAVIQIIHRRGEGGAAEEILRARLAELDGYSIHLYAGQPGASARLACGEL